MPTRRLLLSLVAMLLLAVPAMAELQTFPTGQLTIVTAKGDLRFTVEIATTPAQHEQGLMYRHHIDPGTGMLFDFGHPTTTAFWMKNTLIPLDMLFVGADGRIVNIHERAVPMSEETIPSAGPVRAVIELNGGASARLGIKPGDRVVYPIFGGK
ncbi:MAG TPA: DUF192 domain-containing protein [Stellaceae bacterium]|jgi:hypothetical protein|nr:DUF192 domain-containing protein [Stellaceae bacterium]